MATRKLRIQLEVEVEVDDSALEENGEKLNDDQIAQALYVGVDGGSFLSAVDEAVEIPHSRVLRASRI